MHFVKKLILLLIAHQSFSYAEEVPTDLDCPNPESLPVFYESSELRWEKLIPISSKPIKKRDYSGEHAYKIEPEKDYWFFIPSGSDFRFNLHPVNIKNKTKALLSKLNISTGNATGLFKKQSLTPFNASFKIKEPISGAHVVWLRLNENAEPFYMSFYISYKQPVPQGLPFKQTEKEKEKKKDEDKTCENLNLFTIIDKKEKKKTSLRPYKTKDSEVFYHASHEEPFTIETKSHSFLRFDLKMLLDHQSNKKSYKNWIEVYKNNQLFDLIWFEQATIENQLNYKANKSEIYTKTQSYWVKTTSASSKFTLKPLIPIKVRTVSSDHKFLSKNLNKNKAFQNLSFFRAQNAQETYESILLNARINYPKGTYQNALSALEKLKTHTEYGKRASEIETLIKGQYASFQDISPEGSSDHKSFFKKFSPLGIEHKYKKSGLRLAPMSYLRTFKDSKEVLFTHSSNNNSIKYNLPKTRDKKFIRILLDKNFSNQETFKVKIIDSNNKNYTLISKEIPKKLPILKRLTTKNLGHKLNQEEKVKQGFLAISDHRNIPYINSSEKIQYIDYELLPSVSWIKIKTSSELNLGLQMLSSLNSSLNYESRDYILKLNLNPLTIFQNEIKKSYSETKPHLKIKRSFSRQTLDHTSALKAELQNNWVNLIQYLKYQWTIEKNTIGEIEKLSVYQNESKWLFEELQKLKNNNFYEKLKILSRLSLSTIFEMRSKAVLEKASLLFKDKDYGVFERFTIKHLHSSPPLSTSNKLQNLLFKYYMATGQSEKGFRVFASQVYKNPSLNNIQILIKLSYRLEQFNLVESLSFIIGPTNTPLIEAMKSTLKTKNKSLFTALSKESSFKSLNSKKELKNLDKFVNGKRSSKKYFSKYQKNLFKKLKNKKISSKALQEWIENDQTGSYVFKDQKNSIDKNSPLVSLTSGLKEKLDFHQAYKKKPIKLSLLGPKAYRISIRPLHKKKNLQYSKISDWIQVKKQNQNDLFWPIINNKPSFSLKNSNTPHLGAPGNTEKFLIRAPFGVHTINLLSEKYDYLYKVEEISTAGETHLVPEYNLDFYHSIDKIKDSTVCQKPRIGNATFIGDSKASYKKIKDFSKISKSDLCSQSLFYKNLKNSKKIILSEKSKEDLLIYPEKLYKNESFLQYVSTYKKFIQLYYDFTHNKSAHLAASEAEYIYQNAQQDLKIILKPLWLEFRRLSQWQSFANVIQDDGVWIEENPENNTESIEAQRTQALSGALDGNSHLISSGFALNFKIRNAKSESLKIRVKLANPSELKNKTLKLYYGLKGLSEQSTFLSNRAPERSLKLKVPTGEHVLNIKVPKAARGQYVELKVFKEIKGQFKFLRPKIERTYHITSKKRPLILSVQGPTVIKYQYRNQSVEEQKYLFFKRGNHKVKIPPLTSESSSYVRTFHFVKREPIEFAERLNPKKINLENNIEPKKAPSVFFQTLSRDDLFLPHQSFGSVSSYLAYNSKILAEEPLGNFIQNENFVESGVEFRKAIPSKSLYLKFGLLGRARQFGHSSLGTSFRLTGKWQPTIAFPPLSYWFVNRNYLQKFSEINPVKNVWSSHNLFAIAQHRQIVQGWTHYPQIEVFYREQSLDELLSTNRVFVDQDIFSNYREQNRWGVSIADTITWQTHWDMFLRFGGKYVTDEDLSKAELFRLKASWAQMFKNLELNLDLTYTKFLDASNITDKENSWIHSRFIYDWWLKNQERLEFSSQFSWSPDNREQSFFVSLKYHFGNGRGFTDFYPGERNFKGLKQRLAPKYNLIRNEYKK